MKRNNPDILNKIIDTIEKGFGRVSACKSADIHYGTFLHWIDPEHPTYNNEFSERLKKAENIGLQTLKETLENVILRAATNTNKPAWQAGAWYLERRFNSQYGIKQQLDHTTKGESLNKKPDLSKLTDEELEQLDAIQRKIESKN